jgi:hypothetical protein
VRLIQAVNWVTDKGLSSDIPGLGLLGFSEVFVLRSSDFFPSELFEKNSSASSPNKNPVMVPFPNGDLSSLWFVLVL